MALNHLFFNINTPVDSWLDMLGKLPPNDFILLADNRNDMIWFTTNYLQLLSKQGGNEVAPLYGQLISNLESFAYQLNFTLPIGYEIRFQKDSIAQALFDTLLNFETEPEARFIIWNDAGHLHNQNPQEFAEIFELMVVAAQSNRKGIASTKDDGTPYRVDQRNVFVFEKAGFDQIKKLLNNTYYIPAMENQPGEAHQVLDFNIVELMSVPE